MYSYLFFALSSLSLISAIPISQQQDTSCSSSIFLKGNPFTDRAIYPTQRYRSEAVTTAAAMTDSRLKAISLKVINTGTFIWLDMPSKLSVLHDELRQVPCNNLLGIVLRALPPGYCKSNESSPYDLANYKSEIIDGIGSKSLHRSN